VKYSKATRELAARLCSLRSCDWALNNGASYAVDRSATIGADLKAFSLAWHAHEAAKVGHLNPVHEWAEAEALIRTGWSPS
jgi:hypothetical protein